MGIVMLGAPALIDRWTRKMPIWAGALAFDTVYVFCIPSTYLPPSQDYQFGLLNLLPLTLFYVENSEYGAGISHFSLRLETSESQGRHFQPCNKFPVKGNTDLKF
jgi:hypothetical protein